MHEFLPQQAPSVLWLIYGTQLSTWPLPIPVTDTSELHCLRTPAGFLMCLRGVGQFSRLTRFVAASWYVGLMALSSSTPSQGTWLTSPTSVPAV